MPFPSLWLLDCSEALWLPRLVGLLLEENLLARCTIFVTRSEAAQLPTVGAIRRGLINHFGVAAGCGKVIVADYNIHTDASFGEFDFILCGVRSGHLSTLAQRRLMRLLGASLSSCGLLQMAAPELTDAAHLAPIFLPTSNRTGLYRHAMLTHRGPRQTRDSHVPR